MEGRRRTNEWDLSAEHERIMAKRRASIRISKPANRGGLELYDRDRIPVEPSIEGALAGSEHRCAGVSHLRGEVRLRQVLRNTVTMDRYELREPSAADGRRVIRILGDVNDHQPHTPVWGFDRIALQQQIIAFALDKLITRIGELIEQPHCVIGRVRRIVRDR